MSNIFPTQQEIEEAAKNYSDDHLEHHTTVVAYDGRIEGFKACATWLLAEIQKNASEGCQKAWISFSAILNDLKEVPENSEKFCFANGWGMANLSSAAEMAKKDEEIIRLKSDNEWQTERNTGNCLMYSEQLKYAEKTIELLREELKLERKCVDSVNNSVLILDARQVLHRLTSKRISERKEVGL